MDQGLEQSSESCESLGRNVKNFLVFQELIFIFNNDCASLPDKLPCIKRLLYSELFMVNFN